MVVTFCLNGISYPKLSQRTELKNSSERALEALALMSKNIQDGICERPNSAVGASDHSE